MNDDTISEEILDQLGISRPVYEEVQCIVGHLPTIDELSTLLAMWESNGRQMGLLKWLRGQFHAVERNDYLYTGNEEHRNMHEPKVRECLDIARSIFTSPSPSLAPSHAPLSTGLELYLVGDISSEFVDSHYARQYLHLADMPVAMGTAEEDRAYRLMILEALQGNGTILSTIEITRGGLYDALLRMTQPLGFDILTCREIRLDAFLFGEEEGRFVVALPESEVDYFLIKLGEAGLHCCLLGRTTAGRILVDGMDFGPSSDYAPCSLHN